MRAVRRGEAAYLELMREAKAQFDAEIAKNKEKGKSGRPRKEVAPVVTEVDDIEIDFSDVTPVVEEEEEAEEEEVVVVAAPKPAPRKAAPKKTVARAPAKAKSKAKKVATKKVAAKKPKPKAKRPGR